MIFRFLRRFRKEETGATAIEYGLIASLISVVIFAALRLVHEQVIRMFNYISSNLADSLL